MKNFLDLSSNSKAGQPVLRRCLVALLIFFSCVGASENAASARKALVIGNNAYLHVTKLRNARTDAEAVAKSLSETGFKVTIQLDLNERGMRGAVRSFVAGLEGGDEAVFYYAGHGVQLGAANYLLPIDIQPNDETQVRDEALPLQRVLDDLTERRVRFSIAIIDACRDNPFPKIAGRSIGTTRGLAPTNPATGQMVLFSAGSGQSALDSLSPTDRDPNGLFTRVLLKQLRESGIPADQVLRNVREEVVTLAKSVGHDQVPALYDQSIGQFYFRQKASTDSAAVIVNPPTSVAINPSPVPTSTPVAAPSSSGSTITTNVAVTQSGGAARDATIDRHVETRPPRVAVRRFKSAVDASTWRGYLNSRPLNLEAMIETQAAKVGQFQVVSGAMESSFQDASDYVLTGTITGFSQTQKDLQMSGLTSRVITTTFSVDIRLIRSVNGEIIAAESVEVSEDTASSTVAGGIQHRSEGSTPLASLQRRASKLAVATMTTKLFPVKVTRTLGRFAFLDQGDAIFSVNDEVVISGDDGNSVLRITEVGDKSAKAVLVDGSMPKVGNPVKINAQPKAATDDSGKRFGRQI